MAAAKIEYREKYLALLDELDVKEKEWSEIDDRLRRILTHLLIVADGPSTPEIVAEIRAIKGDIKKGFSFAKVEERVEELKDRVLREVQWSEVEKSLPPVNQVLINIVERLPAPPELEERALKIVETLSHDITREKIGDGAAAITELIFQAQEKIQEEKKNLEKLLLEVTGKLQAMDNDLLSAHKIAEEGFAQSRSHDAAVHADVRDLVKSAKKAADLEDLRSSVLDALDSIRSRMQTKMAAEDARDEALKREVERLRGTVSNMEKEVAEYREKIRKAREESLLDHLTGVYNRLAYKERMDQEEARWRRYGSPFSMVMFDLDKFKDINDTFGHKAGDSVLATVAQIAAKSLRETDFFARYGGEEFVAILTETKLADAVEAAEKIRRAVEVFRFHSKGRRVSITISGGVAQMREGETVEALFRKADNALYLAKKQGRNCCRSETDL